MFVLFLIFKVRFWIIPKISIPIQNRAQAYTAFNLDSTLLGIGIICGMWIGIINSTISRSLRFRQTIIASVILLLVSLLFWINQYYWLHLSIELNKATSWSLLIFRCLLSFTCGFILTHVIFHMGLISRNKSN